MELISVGKILNFHGIKGEAKIGFSNAALIKNTKTFYTENKTPLNVSALRFHKNFGIIKFTEINSISELLEFKGKNLYLPKEIVQSLLDKNEFLIDDLIGVRVFDNEENFIGQIDEIQKTPANDILCVNSINGTVLIPFVSELVPIVDIKNKKVIIKPIEGLL